MIPGSFAYHRPASVKEAVGLLTDLGDEARPLAGGHSLVPMMKLRLATPTHLIDLGGVKELKGIRAEGGEIVGRRWSRLDAADERTAELKPGARPAAAIVDPAALGTCLGSSRSSSGRNLAAVRSCIAEIPS